jgi:hypothetical protein
MCSTTSCPCGSSFPATNGKNDAGLEVYIYYSFSSLLLSIEFT